MDDSCSPTGLIVLRQVGKASPHPGMNERSSRLDDDCNLIVVAVAEPVEGLRSVDGW